jgi:TP901 family phage tail tape measure protein
MAGNYQLGTAEGLIRINYDGTGSTKAQEDFKKVEKSASRSSVTMDRVGTRAIVAGGLLGAGLAFAADKAIDFEKQISAIGAVSGATQPELDALRQAALRIGADTTFSASQAAQAMEELAKAGISTKDILNGAADATVALAAAGGVSLPEAATLAANAMSAFNLTAQDMPKVVDLIAGAANASAIDVGQFAQSLQQSGAVAHLAGVPFSDLAVAIAEMGNAGIKGSDAGTSLKTFLQNLIPTTQKQIGLMQDLGLMTEDGANKFFDASGKVKSLADVSQLLQNALHGMGQEQKIAALQTLFGSDAIRAAAILTDQGASGFNNLAASMGKVKAADVASARLNNTAGQIEQLKGSVETAAISFGTLLIPKLTQLAKGLTDLANWLNSLSPGWKSFALDAIGAAAGILLVVGAIAKIISTVELISGAVTAIKAWTIWTKIASGASKLWAAATWVLNAALDANPVVLIILAIIALVAIIILVIKYHKEIAAWIANVWGKFLDFIKPVTDFFAGPFANFFVQAWNMVKNAFNDAVNFIVALWNGVINFFTALPGRIVSFLEALPGMLLNLFLAALNAAAFAVGFGLGLIVGFFIQLPGRIWNGLVALWGLLTTLFTIAWNFAVNATVNGINFLISFAESLPGRIWNALVALWGLLSNLFNSAWNFAKSATTAGVNAVISFVQSLPGRISGAISAIPGILSGLFHSAMGAAQNAVSSGISGVINGFHAIVNGVRNLAGELFSAGADMIRGAINGVLSAVGGLVSAARDAAQSAVNGFKAALHISSPSRLMADQVGVPIVQGVIVGINKMQSQLEDAAIGIALTGISGAMLPVLGSDGAALSAAALGGNNTVNVGGVTVNVPATVTDPDAIARYSAARIGAAVNTATSSTALRGTGG